jgi:hypothetical protein
MQPLDTFRASYLSLGSAYCGRSMRSQRLLLGALLWRWCSLEVGAQTARDNAKQAALALVSFYDKSTGLFKTIGRSVLHGVSHT